MIPSKVLQLLINAEVIKAIVTAAESKGYKNIALFKPAMESQADKLHFLVSPNKQGLSLFEQSRLGRRLEEILQSENITLMDESHIAEQDKSKIISQICLLSDNSLENVTRFCSEELALKPKMDIRFENNKMIFYMEMPKAELSDEEKEQFINAAVSQFATNLRKKVFPSSGNNFTSKLLSA